MKRGKLFVNLLGITMLLSGCWDVVNLEDRGFIVGTSIDFVRDIHQETKPKFNITNQLVIPAGVRGPTGSGEGDDKPFLNIVNNGYSIYRINEEITAQTSKVPFYEHLAIIIISEEIAKTPKLITQLLDTYIRNVNIRRGTKVVVSRGDPKKLLDFTTPEQKLPAIHIDELLKHSSKQAGFLTPIVVGDLEEFHLNENSYILPLFEVKEDVQYKLGAVFHGPKDKMVGFLTDDEMKGLEIMRGESNGKVIDVTYKDEILALEVVLQKMKMKVDPKNIDQIKVTIDIELNGVIKESFGEENFIDPDTIKSVQKAVAQEVEDSIRNTIDKTQKELNADVFYIWRHIETKHYNIWEKVKNDWETGENYFSKVIFDVNVTPQIYSIGTTNKTD